MKGSFNGTSLVCQSEAKHGGQSEVLPGESFRACLRTAELEPINEARSDLYCDSRNVTRQCRLPSRGTALRPLEDAEFYFFCRKRQTGIRDEIQGYLHSEFNRAGFPCRCLLTRSQIQWKLYLEKEEHRRTIEEPKPKRRIYILRVSRKLRKPKFISLGVYGLARFQMTTKMWDFVSEA